MRIVLNALSARVGSGPTFFANFLPALAAADEVSEYIVIVHPGQSEVIAAMPEGFRVHTVPGRLSSFPLRALWEQTLLPLLLRRWRADALYSTGNITTLLAPCPRVLVMTNSNPFSPLSIGWRRRERVKNGLIRRASALSADRSRRVVFISRNSCDLISRQLSLPREKARVIYYGWREDESAPPRGSTIPRRPTGVGDEGERVPVAGSLPGGGSTDYVLSVSVVLPHKNYDRLMRAFDELVERDGYEGYLIIAGSTPSTAYLGRLLEVRSTLARPERVVVTGHLSGAELSGLYRGSSLFVLPSLEETLGIPLLEAMGAGVPVIASDCSLSPGRPACFNPFREICGEAAIYFDPFSESSIREALRAGLRDPERSRRLVAAGREQVKRFSWERTARETSAVLHEVIG